jgi:hypothetical protein
MPKEDTKHIEYTVLGKKISLPQELIEFYRDNIEDFIPLTAEYLAMAQGCRDSDSAEDIRQGIINGIFEEIQMYSLMNDALKKAFIKGIIS